jgi:hypothetical protein
MLGVMTLDANRLPGNGTKESQANDPFDPEGHYNKVKTEFGNVENSKMPAVTAQSEDTDATSTEANNGNDPSPGSSLVCIVTHSPQVKAKLSRSSLKNEVKKPITPRDGPPLSHKIASFKLKLALPENFYEEAEFIMAENLGHPFKSDNGVFIYVDLSNILVGLEKYLNEHSYIVRDAMTGHANGPLPKSMLDFDAFSLLIERGRPAAKRFMLGTWPVNYSNTFAKMAESSRSRGYETTIWHKVRVSTPGTPNWSWKEQGVDEGIQKEMADALLSHNPGTMILATGDGARSTLGNGFCYYVEKALERGWKVEIFAWETSASAKYCDLNWRYQWREQLRVYMLDKFATDLFVLVSVNPSPRRLLQSMSSTSTSQTAYPRQPLQTSSPLQQAQTASSLQQFQDTIPMQSAHTTTPRTLSQPATSSKPSQPATPRKLSSMTLKK